MIEIANSINLIVDITEPPAQTVTIANSINLEIELLFAP